MMPRGPIGHRDHFHLVPQLPMPRDQPARMDIRVIRVSPQDQ